MRLKMLLLFFALQFSLIRTQEPLVKEAREDKATLYIFRTSDVGSLFNFRFFLDGNYLGKFNYGKYMKLEVTPGEHLLFAKAENLYFLKADLQAGKTYALNAIPRIGVIKATVRLAPVTIEDKRWLKRIAKHLAKARQMTFTPKELQKGQQKDLELLRRARRRYEKLTQKGKVFPLLDQPIVLGALQTAKD